MTALDVAPVTVVTPWGEKLEPVRVEYRTPAVGDMLRVTDRDGNLLAGDTIDRATHGRRTSTLEGAAGRWTVRQPCSCDGSKARLRKAWAGVPRVAT